MNKLRLLATLLLVAACSLAVTPSTKKKAAAKKAAAKSSSKPGIKGKKKASTPSWRSTQRTPTPDRYKEIQQALSGKGYAANPTGVWDAPSIEALKKFQADQNLEPSG